MVNLFRKSSFPFVVGGVNINDERQQMGDVIFSWGMTERCWGSSEILTGVISIHAGNVEGMSSFAGIVSSLINGFQMRPNGEILALIMWDYFISIKSSDKLHKPFELFF